MLPAKGAAARVDHDGQPLLAQALERFFNVVLVIIGHRIAVGFLVAAARDRRQRHRVILRCRLGLLGQDADHPALGGERAMRAVASAFGGAFSAVIGIGPCVCHRRPISKGRLTEQFGIVLCRPFGARRASSFACRREPRADAAGLRSSALSGLWKRCVFWASSSTPGLTPRGYALLSFQGSRRPLMAAPSARSRSRGWSDWQCRRSSPVRPARGRPSFASSG